METGSRKQARARARTVSGRSALFLATGLTFGLLLILTGGASYSQHEHHPGSHTGSHTADPMSGGTPGDDWMPTEVGQDAFAALAEMVQRLDADPATDWKRVSIRTLRDHLVDMYRVTLLTEVAEEPIPNGFRARVTGDGPTRDAVQRMVPAHASMLGALGYQAEAETTETGVVLTVRVADPEPAPEKVDRLRALGFFGVMTLGGHHRAHHRAMATGRPVHGGHP
jgi:hypothetical protein